MLIFVWLGVYLSIYEELVLATIQIEKTGKWWQGKTLQMTKVTKQITVSQRKSVCRENHKIIQVAKVA